MKTPLDEIIIPSYHETGQDWIIMQKVFFILLLLSGLGCTLRPKPSTNVLVIAVDQLGFNQVPCTNDSSDNSKSGFDLLCQDSVRFTHAYTTSLLSGPAIGSILTGLYPIDHGLRNNGSNDLPSSLETVGEMANDSGYQTLFYSGGAPILRKLNLHQGFETFDDNISPLLARTFRPFAKSEAIFEGWLKDNPHNSFFSFFYVPDLAFTTFQTQNELGENRNLTFDSQLEAFNQNLGKLIKTLKQQKRWENTLVVLVGLNAPAADSRSDELTNLNLFSERTQVALLMKPPLKPRDQGIHWTYDDNVSLADVGATLAQFLNKTIKNNIQFPTVALNKALQEPTSHDELTSASRVLLIESAWGAWHELSNIRYAFRQDQFLYLFDEKPKIFNSLIDRLELTPLSATEGNAKAMVENLNEKIQTAHLEPFHDPSKENFLKWSGLEDYHALTNINKDRGVILERLAHRLLNDRDVTSQYVLQMIQQQDWNGLLRWSKGTKNADLKNLAELNLKGGSVLKSGIHFQNPCLQILIQSSPTTNDVKGCSNPISSSFNEWILSENNPSDDVNIRDLKKKKFLRAYEYFLLDRKVAQLNWAFQGIWDLSPDLTPLIHTIDLQMALPSLQKYRSQWMKNYNFIKEESN